MTSEHLQRPLNLAGHLFQVFYLAIIVSAFIVKNPFHNTGINHVLICILCLSSYHHALPASIPLLLACILWSPQYINSSEIFVKRCLFSRLNRPSFFSPSVHVLCCRPDHLSDLLLDLLLYVNKRQTRRCLNKSQIEGKDGSIPWAWWVHYYKSCPGCSLFPAARAHCWFMFNFSTVILTGFPAKPIKLNSSGRLCIIQFQKR